MIRKATILAAWILAATAVLAQDKRDGYDDVYFDPEGKHEVTIVPDQIGILVNDRLSAKDVGRAIGALPFKVVKEFRGGLYLVAIGKPLERHELVQVARELRRREKAFLQTGLVVRVPGVDTPVIATDEFIVGLRGDVRAEELAEKLGARVAVANPFIKRQYVLRVDGDVFEDTIAITRRLAQSDLVEYAYPNFINVFHDNELVPNDTLFGDQWHLRNTGQAGGTATADARNAQAWDFTLGNGSTIAVIENGGFEVNHPDLMPNLWTNPGETGGNSTDDDNNLCVDDVNGCDFGPCSAATPNCGLGNPAPANAGENHGTSVAGVAAARGDNMLGVSGSCPRCGLILLRTGYAASDFAKSLAFGYAQTKNAAVATNSWGGGGALPNTTMAINTAATAGRGGLGLIMTKASGNANSDVCTGSGAATDPTTSNANIIAVSSSSNQDRKVVMATFGNCVDVLAPSHRGYAATDPHTGTLCVTTTDRTTATGYNNAAPPGLDMTGITETADQNYTRFFGGTSSATPLAAGVAAMAINVRPSLTRVQTQNLLQDTAGKIEPATASYATATGYSAPMSGTATHAFGRINALEAVRLVAPAASGGKNGVDVFIRDNRLDWGNTDPASNVTLESSRGFIPHWQSVDIKVDAPPFGAAPTNNAQFEAFVDENPLENVANQVYVRIRNRGPATAASGTIKLHWVFAGAALPNLPADFWTAFPADPASTAIWHPSGTQPFTNLAYSGASVANTGGDAAQIFTFTFNAPLVDPMAAQPNHYCLFVVIDSPDDRVGPKARPVVAADFVPDLLTPTDNNVTHRNVFLVGDGVADMSDTFFVSNPLPVAATIRLRVDAPKNVRVKLDRGVDRPIRLRPGQRVLVTATLANADPKRPAEVTIIQETVPAQPNRRFRPVIGGITYLFRGPRVVDDLLASR